MRPVKNKINVLLLINIFKVFISDPAKHAQETDNDSFFFLIVFK